MGRPHAALLCHSRGRGGGSVLISHLRIEHPGLSRKITGVIILVPLAHHHQTLTAELVPFITFFHPLSSSFFWSFLVSLFTVFFLFSFLPSFLPSSTPFLRHFFFTFLISLFFLTSFLSFFLVPWSLAPLFPLTHLFVITHISTI